MKAEYVRLGTDRGGQIEIVLRPDQYKRPGEKSVTITVPTGAEFKYDHPKDVSEFLKLSLAEVLGIVDNLIEDARARSRQERAAQSSVNSSGTIAGVPVRRGRFLELD